jgi:hypothetical protein
MENISHLSDEELDVLLLAQAKTNWQKVAMIIASALRPYETFDEDRVTERIVALAIAGKLESTGDVRNWRHSEVRLPPR